jgi:hypothetical protein
MEDKISQLRLKIQMYKINLNSTYGFGGTKAYDDEFDKILELKKELSRLLRIQKLRIQKLRTQRTHKLNKIFNER